MIKTRVELMGSVMVSFTAKKKKKNEMPIFFNVKILLCAYQSMGKTAHLRLNSYNGYSEYKNT